MALVPPPYLDAVGVLEERRMVEDRQEFAAVATGTLVGYTARDQTEAEPGATLRNIFLVTNKHVIEGESEPELFIRFNQGSGSRRFPIRVKDDDGNDVFHTSERFDIAVTGIDAGALRDAGAQFDFLRDENFLDLAGLESQGVVGGDGVFVLGFPMGIAGTQRKYAIVRSGVIARVDREIVADTNGFLIDCSVFPGNSGGPVILKPEVMSIEGTPATSKAHVIGIVASYVPFIDVAISQQTRRPRITFEENSGLASVVPLDAVDEIVHRRLDQYYAGKGPPVEGEMTSDGPPSELSDTADAG